MPSKRVRLSNKDLEDLEGRVTQHLLSKIETIVTKQCKEFFDDNCSDVLNEPLAIQQERETLKSNLMSLKNDFKFLNNKEDSTIGSLSFVASEYHDFRKKIASITYENLELRKKLSGLTETIGMINKNLTKTEEQLEALEQYGRRDNLEIHNIPWTKNETTNEIVKKIANTLNVKLDDHDISTSHRIYSNQTSKPNSPNINSKQSEAERNEHPPIIVRFVNRDKRNEIFAKRLRPKPISNSTSGRKIDFTIKENLTKFRKMLYKEARKVQLSTGYKFLWTWQGQILMRRNEMS